MLVVERRYKIINWRSWVHGPTAAFLADKPPEIPAAGESAELVQLCRKNLGKPLALLCNNQKSSCWSLTQIKLPIIAGPEYGNATKTYTNATAACIVLASHMAGRTWLREAERVAAAWLKDTTVLWVRQKGSVRSYDFTNPAQVKESTLEDPANLEKVPRPILDALRAALDVPGAPPQPPAAPKK